MRQSRVNRFMKSIPSWFRLRGTSNRINSGKNRKEGIKRQEKANRVTAGTKVWKLRDGSMALLSATDTSPQLQLAAVIIPHPQRSENLDVETAGESLTHAHTQCCLCAFVWPVAHLFISNCSQIRGQSFQMTFRHRLNPSDPFHLCVCVLADV